MLEKFLKYLKVEKNYSAQTIRSYGDDLRQFFAFCGVNPSSKPFPSIKHRQVRNWLSSLLATGHTARSVNRKLSSLRSFYKFLILKGIVVENPLQKVVAPKAGKKLPPFLSVVEMGNLFNRVEYSDDFEGARDFLIIEFFYFTGLRVSELVSLKHKDINLSTLTVKVLGKGSKERIVPIHPELKESILCYIKMKENTFGNILSSDFFIVTSKGKKPYEKLLYRIVNKYLTLVTSLEKKSPHVLRHTFATHLLDMGANINAIKELLGHSSLSATQVYTHTTIDKLKSTYQQAHPRA
ncbi:MAG TPA: tyrosine-type recombinase/integrase [Tenuifilaceae bacterium]|nr:tyrosine-type recombinase/integrase [Tenuifilaceae bacterium]HPE19504.1 tyrosine-type recombinase/integrase [Tenuifilaceae bacterium]HPJ47054.1 tyrosine-type recombinase/integrase [Tenuifilaceae bacterium]HPQ34642.1 tyrosine-type recombinase/integrase [Tenuifilaceae bacterium]HRX69311.1 tyrosine-type recombinase/integrase [Tenuifilaceae bacterium]